MVLWKETIIIVSKTLSNLELWNFNPSQAAIKISINATAAGFICKNIFPTLLQVKKNIKYKSVTYSKYTYTRMFVNKFSAMLTISIRLFIKFKFILFYLIFITTFYTWFSTHVLSQPVHRLSAEIRSLSTHPVLVLPRNHTFTIKTSASYLEKSLWTSKLLISAL